MKTSTTLSTVLGTVIVSLSLASAARGADVRADGEVAGPWCEASGAAAAGQSDGSAVAFRPAVLSGAAVDRVVSRQRPAARFSAQKTGTILGAAVGGAAGLKFGILLAAAGNLDCEADCHGSPVTFWATVGGAGLVGAFAGGLAGGLVGTGLDAMHFDTRHTSQVRVGLAPARRGVAGRVSIDF